jgi:hypothetical protein
MTNRLQGRRPKGGSNDRGRSIGRRLAGLREKRGDHRRDRVARARRARVADSSAPDEITRIREFYDSTATDYDQWLGYYERWMNLREARRRLLSRARGRTLEVGVGTGVNLAHYRPTRS